MLSQGHQGGTFIASQHVAEAAQVSGDVRLCRHIRQLASGTHAAVALGSKTQQVSLIYKSQFTNPITSGGVSHMIAVSWVDKAGPSLVCLSWKLMLTMKALRMPAVLWTGAWCHSCMMCYAMSCSVVHLHCCAVLCCAVLCCAVPCCIMH